MSPDSRLSLRSAVIKIRSITSPAGLRAMSWLLENFETEYYCATDGGTKKSAMSKNSYVPGEKSGYTDRLRQDCKWYQ